MPRTMCMSLFCGRCRQFQKHCSYFSYYTPVTESEFPSCEIRRNLSEVNARNNDGSVQAGLVSRCITEHYVMEALDLSVHISGAGLSLLTVSSHMDRSYVLSRLFSQIVRNYVLSGLSSHIVGSYVLSKLSSHIYMSYALSKLSSHIVKSYVLSRLSSHMDSSYVLCRLSSHIVRSYVVSRLSTYTGLTSYTDCPCVTLITNVL